MSERMWISEELEKVRTERDQALLDNDALRAKLKSIGKILNEYANHPLIRVITKQIAGQPHPEESGQIWDAKFGAPPQ